MDEALEELSTAHKQLRVAMEELRWRNDQLSAMRGLAEKQRRHYRELFEFAPDAYLVMDTAGTIQEANHKAAEMLGVRQDFLMGKPIVVFIPTEKRDAFHDLLVRLSRSETSSAWEMEMQPRDGSPFPAADLRGLAAAPAGADESDFQRRGGHARRRKIDDPRLGGNGPRPQGRRTRADHRRLGYRHEHPRP